jgi:hypothetical protein
MFTIIDNTQFVLRLAREYVDDLHLRFVPATAKRIQENLFRGDCLATQHQQVLHAGFLGPTINMRSLFVSIDTKAAAPIP